VSEAVSTVAEGATAAVATPVEVVPDASAIPMDEASRLSQILSVEGFDHDKVSALTEEAELDLLQKTMLTTGLMAAQENPELLKVALDKVREALGL